MAYVVNVSSDRLMNCVSCVFLIFNFLFALFTYR